MIVTKFLIAILLSQHIGVASLRVLTDGNIRYAVDLYYNNITVARIMYGDIAEWDVSQVSNMHNLFSCKSGLEFSLASWNTSSVTSLDAMFRKSHFNQPIGYWDTSKVTSLDMMFYGSEFNQPIGNWNTSKVTSMAALFSGSDFNQDLRHWDINPTISMDNGFEGAEDFGQAQIVAITQAQEESARIYRTENLLGPVNLARRKNEKCRKIVT
eukprot:CAMPEP_0184064332 /NCGR_PEP_ID=MMETSP0957-20130417/1880_1 /TAXON_ID=627963 /ORGANISM="Aplanochytrium sp, Strain PBS07" /LENGTH=211 /DNA_ID=CAMNT_0026361669 /DNA_START=122 /DNA_END=757 /DNA_ORIENTATION=-